MDYRKVHRVNLEKVKEIGNNWYKPILHIGEKPTYNFEGYEGIKVRLVYPEVSREDEREFYIKTVFNMARIQLATWITSEDPEKFNDVRNKNREHDFYAVTLSEAERVVRKALKEKAGTVLLESLTLTYNLDGVTRALTAEINRHRAMGFGEQSQRITDTRHHPIRLPPAVVEAGFEEEYKRVANEIKDLYAKMVDSGKVPIEQARNIMPIGLITHEVETGNLRGWLDVWWARIQPDAMDEHQILTRLEIEEFRNKLPSLYKLLLETGRIPDIDNLEW